MFNYIENFNSQEIVTVEEKFNFSEMLISKGANGGGYNISPQVKDGKTYLIRNLIDDSYNLELATYNYLKNIPGNDRPYVAINNKYLFFGSNNNPFYNFMPYEYKKGFRYKAHRSFFDNLKLQDTFTMTFGVDYQGISPYLHYILTPEFNSKIKFANIGFDQILLIKSLKKIVLSLPSELLARDFTSQEIIKFKPTINLIYNEMYIVPEKINQLKGNYALLKIYMRNEDNSSHKYDYKFSDGLLQTSSLNKKLTTIFRPNEYKEKTYNFGFGSATLLGEVIINESTFYDYDKKITVEGFGNDSIMGETIPYNFQGEFKRDIQMHLNSAFGKFNIRLFGNIIKPLLEVDEGIFQLSIKEDHRHLKTTWKISPKNMTFLRARLRAKPPFITSLQGLKSLSEYFA